MSACRRALAPALLVLVAACSAPTVSAPASVQPSVSTESSVAASASAAPSADPSAEASAEVEATELERTGEALAPGRYTRAGFAPRITFEISEGEWYAEQLYTGFFDVQQEVGSPDVIAVQFAKPSEIYSEVGSSVRVETAADAAAAVRGNPGLTVFGESESLIDGRGGIVLEVEHAGRSAANVGVMAVPPGPLSIAPERRLWIAFFDTDDGLLAVMVGGSVTRWDEALAAAEPILETVTIAR